MVGQVTLNVSRSLTRSHNDLFFLANANANESHWSITAGDKDMQLHVNRQHHHRRRRRYLNVFTLRN